MSTLRITIFVIAALHCDIASAEGTAGVTGADLLNDCKKGYAGDFLNWGYCLGFIRAVWQMSDKGCGPAGMQWGEVMQIVTKYAADNPEWLHRPAEEVVEAALVKTFCKRR